MSAELGGAYFSSSFRCMLVVPRANHPFPHVFGFSRHALLGAVAPADKKVRSQVLRTAKQTLSVLVQTGLAELLLSAEPGRGVPAPAAAAA